MIPDRAHGETEPAPRNAYEAADQLAAAGHHVHIVADAESVCHTGQCPKERP
ncbi:hypothetical protein ACWENS_05505 [Streptomyces sp. NPDC004532]